MFDINAKFMRKEPDSEAKPCVVEKAIRLPGSEYDSFARSMLLDQDFIHDNVDSMYHDSATGKLHCLMVVGEGRPDGILVDSPDWTMQGTPPWFLGQELHYSPCAFQH